MAFSYFNPVRIKFDVEFTQILRDELGGQSALVLTSRSFAPKIEDLRKYINITQVILVPPNPQLAFFGDIWAQSRGASQIIALGGGSVIDAAKAVSLDIGFGEFDNLLKNGAGEGAKNIKKANVYALPTTAGTSSELTKWATIWESKHNKKHSLMLEHLYCQVAIYDISLMQNMPLNLSVHTALDALSHSVESLWNKNANPISTNNALRAMDLILEYLPLLYERLTKEAKKRVKHAKSSDMKSYFTESRNIESSIAKSCNTKSCAEDLRFLRQRLALASIHAGLAFSNTQTALAHAISYPLTMQFHIPHGLACSFSLPYIIESLPKKSLAFEILKPYKKRILRLFKQVNISRNPRDYGLDSINIREIFHALNARAKNSIAKPKVLEKRLLKAISQNKY